MKNKYGIKTKEFCLNTGKWINENWTIKEFILWNLTNPTKSYHRNELKW